MEDYNNIIEGILYLKGDEGIDIKELSLILEISKKEAVEAMDHWQAPRSPAYPPLSRSEVPA